MDQGSLALLLTGFASGMMALAPWLEPVQVECSCRDAPAPQIRCADGTLKQYLVLFREHLVDLGHPVVPVCWPGPFSFSSAAD